MNDGKIIIDKSLRRQKKQQRHPLPRGRRRQMLF